jgi:hypothetical protein
VIVVTFVTVAKLLAYPNPMTDAAYTSTITLFGHVAVAVNPLGRK